MPLPDKAYTVGLEHIAKGKKGTVFGGENEVGVTHRRPAGARSQALIAD